MTLNEFKTLIMTALPVGSALDNPQRGTSKIICYSNTRISYRRRNSRICPNFKDLHDAYIHFRGEHVTTNQLREFRPHVYDSKAGGHNCNCTFLFIILHHLGLSSPISGAGRSGRPFTVEIYPHVGC